MDVYCREDDWANRPLLQLFVDHRQYFSDSSNRIPMPGFMECIEILNKFKQNNYRIHLHMRELVVVDFCLKKSRETGRYKSWSTNAQRAVNLIIEDRLHELFLNTAKLGSDECLSILDRLLVAKHEIRSIRETCLPNNLQLLFDVLKCNSRLHFIADARKVKTETYFDVVNELVESKVKECLTGMDGRVEEDLVQIQNNHGGLMERFVGNALGIVAPDRFTQDLIRTLTGRRSGWATAELQSIDTESGKNILATNIYSKIKSDGKLILDDLQSSYKAHVLSLCVPVETIYDLGTFAIFKKYLSDTILSQFINLSEETILETVNSGFYIESLYHIERICDFLKKNEPQMIDV